MADEDQTPKPTEEAAFFRSWLVRALLVIVPALIAGFFSITPKLYDELTKPRAALSGPAINTSGGFRQIFSLTVENTGKLPLTGIEIEIKLPTGTQIESHAIEQSGGLSPLISPTNDAYRAHLERLLPTETVSASLMTTSTFPDTRLRIALRSNEVLGALRTPVRESGPRDLLLSGFLVTIATGVGFFSFLLIAKPLRAWLPTLADRSNKVRYIAVLSTIPNLPRSVLSGEHDISYIAAGDLFLEAGLHGEKDVRERCVLALKALLAADSGTIPTSLAAIRANLEALGCNLSDDDFTSLRKQANSSADIFHFRKRMWAFFKDSVPVPK